MKTTSRKFTYTYLVASLLLLMAWFGVAYAEGTAFRNEPSVSIKDNQSVQGDFYFLSEEAFISGLIDGDVMGVTGKATINGEVSEDVFLVSGSASMDSVIGGDVRVVAWETVIAQPVSGDVFVVGNQLTILSSAVVDGNIYFFGKEAEIKGEVKGSINGEYGSLRVDGVVGDGIDVTVEKGMVLGGQASIEGNINHRSSRSINRSTDAVVEGDINEIKVVADEITLKDQLSVLFILLFASLLGYLFARRKLIVMVDDIVKNPVLISLVGASAMLLIPVVSMILILSALGLLVGVLGIALFIFVSMLALIISGPLLGSLIARLISPEYELSLVATCFGTILIFALPQIPHIGPFLFLLIYIISVGSILYLLFRALR